MNFLRLFCGCGLLLSLSAPGQGLKQQSLFDVGISRQPHANDNEAIANTAHAARPGNQDTNDIAPNNDVIDLVDSDDEVEYVPRPRGVAADPRMLADPNEVEYVPRPRGVAADPRMLADPNEVEYVPRPRGVAADPRMLADPNEVEYVPRPRGVAADPRMLADPNDNDSNDEVEIVADSIVADPNLLVRPAEEGLQEDRNVRPRVDPPEWDLLQYIGVTSVSDLPRYLRNAGANNLIGPMVEQGCEAFQHLKRLQFIKEGHIPRNLFSPDGWMPYLGSSRVFALLNFIGDTRTIVGQRAVNGNSDGTFVEPCLETIINVFAAVFEMFGVEISVARIIARCIIVFANRMPFDGRYDWYSRARRTFMDVARETDPLQRRVIEYVLRNCFRITHAMIFGRPSFDTYGDPSWWRTRNIVLHQATILYHPACVLMGWMTQEARDNWVNTIGRIVADLLGVSPRHFTSEEANRIIPIRRSWPQLPEATTFGAYLNANGHSIVMNPELFTTLKSYCNGGDERSAKRNQASLRSAQVADVRGTMNTFGEYACDNCFEFHLVRLGGRCGIVRSNGKPCRGACYLVKNVHGEWVQALDYALNTGGRDGTCVRNHIGLIGQMCTCHCSGTQKSGGTFAEGFDVFNYPLQVPPPSILSYQTRTSDDGIVASFTGAKALARHLRPILEQKIEETSAAQVKQSYPWAFGKKGALAKLNHLTPALTTVMIENPNRPIIVGESAYKMRPWDLNRGS